MKYSKNLLMSKSISKSSSNHKAFLKKEKKSNTHHILCAMFSQDAKMSFSSF